MTTDVLNRNPSYGAARGSARLSNDKGDPYSVNLLNMNPNVSQNPLSSINATNTSLQVNQQNIQSLSNVNFDNYKIPPFEDIQVNSKASSDMLLPSLNNIPGGASNAIGYNRSGGSDSGIPPSLCANTGATTVVVDKEDKQQ